MDKANTIFTFEGVDVIIPCSTKDKMGTICQRYTTKIEKNINSLVFLYGGNQLNFQLSFEEQANSLDKQSKNMNILVYKKVDYSFISESEENINLTKDKIDDIIKSINNIKDNIAGVKSIVDNIIKKSTINSLNTQLKKIYAILNTITKDIEKNNERLKDLLNDNQNIINKTKSKYIIKGALDIKLSEIDKNIILFNTDLNDGIDVYLNNKKIEMIKNNNNWIIDNKNFPKDGKYII